MNNHWHTNYRAEQDGPTVFRYAIWPHGPSAQRRLQKFGVSMSQPLDRGACVGPGRVRAALARRAFERAGHGFQAQRRWQGTGSFACSALPERPSRPRSLVRSAPKTLWLIATARGRASGKRADRFPLGASLRCAQSCPDSLNRLKDALKPLVPCILTLHVRARFLNEWNRKDGLAGALLPRPGVWVAVGGTARPRCVLSPPRLPRRGRGNAAAAGKLRANCLRSGALGRLDHQPVAPARLDPG